MTVLPPDHVTAVHDDVGAVLDAAEVLVCCGSGGVGKTTTAAVLGLEAAHRGHRAVVVTIDPARRLADALGLPLGTVKTHLRRARLFLARARAGLDQGADDDDL